MKALRYALKGYSYTASTAGLLLGLLAIGNAGNELGGLYAGLAVVAFFSSAAAILIARE